MGDEGNELESMNDPEEVNLMYQPGAAGRQDHHDNNPPIHEPANILNQQPEEPPAMYQPLLNPPHVDGPDHYPLGQGRNAEANGDGPDMGEQRPQHMERPPPEPVVRHRHNRANRDGDRADRDGDRPDRDGDRANRDGDRANRDDLQQPHQHQRQDQGRNPGEKLYFITLILLAVLVLVVAYSVNLYNERKVIAERLLQYNTDLQQCRNVGQECNNVREQLINCRRDRDVDRAKWDQKVEDYANQIKEYSGYQAKLSTLEVTHATTVSSLNECNTNLGICKQTKQDHDTLKQKHSELEKQNTKHETEWNTCKQQLETCKTNENNCLLISESLNTCQKDLALSQQSFTSKRNELTTERIRFDACVAELTVKKNDLKKCENTTIHYQTERKFWEAEQKKYEKTIEEFKETVKETTNKMKKMNDDFVKLQNECSINETKFKYEIEIRDDREKQRKEFEKWIQKLTKKTDNLEKTLEKIKIDKLHSNNTQHN